MRVLEPPAPVESIEGEPLKITARMGEPIVTYDGVLHFDGILSWCASREYISEHGDDLPPIGGPWMVDFDLPLARWRVPPVPGCDERLLDADGMLWGWCASAGEAIWLSHGKVEVRKRPAIDEMVRFSRDKTYNAGAGPTKAKDLTFPTLFAREVTWYVRGEREAVKRLLDVWATHLGKLHGHGHGKVLEWRVETSPVDWSIQRDGLLMRRMPREGGQRGGIRAPYWHRSRQVPCAQEGEPA